MSKMIRLTIQKANHFVLLTIAIVLCILCIFTSRNLETFISLKNTTEGIKVMKALSDVVKMNKNVTEHLPSFKLKDWHNYTFIEHEKQREGIGEQGKPASLPRHRIKIIQEVNMIYKYRINAALSDIIALNRSLPDVRHPACKNITYLESLPSVSIIVVFYNEYLSTLLRTLWSVLNRSPEHLIKEILLVDDGSTEDYLKKKLDNYLVEFPKVKMVRLPNRTGVVGARLTGAKLAKGTVLIFLDAHTEVNVNWLPPLLEPIALNYRTVVTPLIDRIDRQTFEYHEVAPARGWFDWSMNYVRNPMLPEEMNNLPDPYETPAMMGMFAISRHLFWKIGGYDPGLKMWGGEQMELSLKIWMCGGRLLEAPCSRVGHIVRDVNSIYESHVNNTLRNHRRIADVWMDEFAKYVYLRNPQYTEVSPGDISKQKAFRESCKPFKWFMNKIAKDVRQNYTLMDIRPPAEGWIQPLGKEKLCIDVSLRQNMSSAVILTRCSKNSVQICQFTIYNEIKIEKLEIMSCWEVPGPWDKKTGVLLNCCDGRTPTRKWQYHQDLKLIVHMMSGFCLDHDAWSLDVFVNRCDENSETQRWVIVEKDVVLSYNWELDLEP